MRIFLAIEIPNKIKKNLVGIQRELEPQLSDVRWESPEKLHLTLVFLGEVEEERVSELEETVRKGVKGIKGINGIEVGFAEVGVFPPKKPRVVLVEVGDGVEQVAELQKRLAEALSAAGFEFAKLSKPHVTLGRFKKGIKGIKGVNPAPRRVRGKGVEFEVREVAIVESKLHPAGAIHTPIARIPLC